MKKIIVAVALLFSIVQQGRALTAADIISRARIALRDTSSDVTRQKFSDAQLLSFLNDGQREANAFDFVLQSSYTFSLTGGVQEHALPSDFLTPWRVTLNDSTKKKLDQTSFNQQDATSIAWQSISPGTPNSYYIYLNVSPTIGFVPTPSTTYVTQSTPTVTVWYIQQTTDLTSTSQTPFNGWSQLLPYHSGLSYYIDYRGLLILGDTDLAQNYLTEWQQWVAALKVGLGKQPDFNPGFGGTRK